ncbi:MAG TPA: hypothetical protein VK698_39885 [Kofleriaceae bacterium]|nr:hypothetical protein [Kofleriaceae bacterium]
MADDIVCIDLDHVISDEGVLAGWAAELLAQLPETFIELSQSGTGLHVWGRGGLAQGRRVAMPEGTGLEVYGDRRYIAMTGQVWRDAPSVLADLSGVLPALT